MTKLLFLCLLMLPAAVFAQSVPDDKTAIPEKIDAVATFAGGCFWCMESEFEGLDGVSGVTSGYAGPKTDKPPTYEDVGTGESGYLEAVSVTYDPAKTTYEDLLVIFWDNVDPFDPDGQFCDQGSQYAAAIFVNNDAEEKLARESLAVVEKKHGKEVATEIKRFEAFYPAEEYHQDYYKTNALRYKNYRKGCGRDARLEELAK